MAPQSAATKLSKNGVVSIDKYGGEGSIESYLSVADLPSRRHESVDRQGHQKGFLRRCVSKDQIVSDSQHTAQLPMRNAKRPKAASLELRAQ